MLSNIYEKTSVAEEVLQTAHKRFEEDYKIMQNYVNKMIEVANIEH